MIRVAFSGASVRAGPLTLAQRNVLRSMRHQATDGHNFTLWLSVPVPPDFDAADAVRALVVRHESLRTTYRFDPEPEQRVAGAGEINLEVYEAGDAPDEFAHDLVTRLSATRIDVTDQLPVRGALVTTGGAPARIVLVISHLAVDAASVEVLRRDLFSTAPAQPTRQPLDQAAVESTPSSRRRALAALDHWKALLSRGPQCTFAVPSAPVRGATARMARLRSTDLARAAATIAARTGTSGSATVLAALAAIVGHHTGHDECLVTAVAGNRHVPELRDYVGPLAQDALISFDLRGSSFDALVRRAWAASLTGYRHTRFDALALWKTIDQTGYDRGTCFARDFVFNDRSGFARPPAAPAAPATPAAPASQGDGSRFGWLPGPDLPTRFVCYVNRLDREAELVMWADASRLPPARLELALRGVERLLVDAAERSVDLADVGKLTGLDPVDRGPGWVFVDSCWVELDEVRRLLRDALPAHRSEVAVVPGDGLVAHLDGPDLDPAEAHRTCMAALPGRETAMAPHRYVVTTTP